MQTIRWGSPLIAALAMAGCGGNDGPAAAVQVSPPATSASYPGVTCETVKVPARDGTLLMTNLYKPGSGAADAKYPVVLIRNSYGQLFGEGCFAGGEVGFIRYAQNGYVLVHQEVRGTHLSDGTFGLMTQEANDGFDAVEWSGHQSWSTGKVGLIGQSYLGLTAWQAALQSPPSLAAMSVQITGSDYHDNWTYENGVFDLLLNLSWPAAAFEPDQIIRAGKAAGAAQATIDQQVADWNTATAAKTGTEWANMLPLTSFSLFKAHQPFYYDWLSHPYYDAYWQKMDLEGNYDKIKVPARISGATYDLFNVGTIRNFQGMRSTAGTEEARVNTKLVWQAYGHSGDSQAPSFGSDAIDPALDMLFFDHYLKGANNGYEQQPTVRAYMLVPPDQGTAGSGFWISGDSFPLAGTVSRKYYFGSSGSANTRNGSGFLTVDPTRASGTDSFIYDPANPVPTVGGNVCCLITTAIAGAREQSSVEARQDVLVYTSDVLQADLPIFGTVNASFWATSSAVDTDFTVKLVDVRPDGQTNNVLDRIVRASLRAGSKLPASPIVPGQAYQYTLELGNAAMVLPAGHKIRVQVSSSNFPRFGRNLNTGKDNNSTSDFVSATQNILHDATHQSYIDLPIAPIPRP